jgi:hypothetical protein
MPRASRNVTQKLKTRNQAQVKRAGGPLEECVAGSDARGLKKRNVHNITILPQTVPIEAIEPFRGILI